LKHIEEAKKVFKLEAEALLKISTSLNGEFTAAVNEILKTEGKVIVIGMGKSGIIGKKIAATLASTGTPSFFMHPGEGYHGDLGMIESKDIVVLVSNSGETKEVVSIIPFLEHNKNIVIAITGKPNSTLAKFASQNLDIFVESEGCPLNLAPMASTTATLAMGDALAASLMKAREFKDIHFARFHPGGSLGKKLSKVKDLMKTEVLTTCLPSATIKEIVKQITLSGCGLVVVIDEGVIVGVITDGDIRRAMENESTFFSLKASDLMSESPKKILQDKIVEDAKKMMVDAKINSLLVVNSGDFLVGCIQMYDLGM